MLDTLAALVPADKDLPRRAWTLDVRARVLDGVIYDVLPYQFHEEKNGAGEYVPLHERRPNVRTGLIRTVVDDSVSLLFSEGHFPSIQCEDEGTKKALQAVTKDARLNQVLIQAATRGSVGSVAILVRFLSKRVFCDVMATGYLTPTWNPLEPDTLLKVTEQRKVTGEQLQAAGYTIASDDLKVQFWFRREWDATTERWFKPWKCLDDKPRITEDKARSTIHGLGFVPIVWIKNLPGGDDTDGDPTFGPEATNTVMSADYLLSQAGRGLKYASDPTLLIKEPAADEGTSLVRSAANALVVDKDGDAKLLEINGTASDAVIAYVEKLREFALERMHGNRSSADKLSAAQSGRALELMHQALIWLADKLRASYGEGGLLALYRMIVAGSQKYPLTINGTKHALNPSADLSLTWPAWFPPTADDRVQIASALAQHINSGTMSAETAVQTIAADYDIEDVAAELARIDADRTQKLAELTAAKGAAKETI
jgi:hypothetical protein